MGPKKISGQKSTQKSSDVAYGNNPGWSKLTGGASKLGGTGGGKKHMSHSDKKKTY